MLGVHLGPPTGAGLRRVKDGSIDLSHQHRISLQRASREPMAWALIIRERRTLVRRSAGGALPMETGSRKRWVSRRLHFPARRFQFRWMRPRHDASQPLIVRTTSPPVAWGDGTVRSTAKCGPARQRGGWARRGCFHAIGPFGSGGGDRPMGVVEHGSLSSFTAQTGSETRPQPSGSGPRLSDRRIGAAPWS